MKEIVLITTHPELTEAVETIVADAPVGVTRVDDWPGAKDRLVERHHDLVCIDYEDVKIEGLDSFIQLDNILTKEDATGILILRDASRRAREFGDNLASFAEAVEFRGPGDQPDLEAALDDALGDPHATGEVQCSLPHLEDGGDFQSDSVLRIVQTIRRTEATGILEMSMDAIQRRWGFNDGELLAIDDGGFSSVESLAPAFAWTRGQWTFTPDTPPDAEAVALWEIALKAVYNHVSQRTAMDAMMARIQDYATASEQGKRLAEALGDEGLSSFVDTCDGHTTLEQALSSLGANATRGFQAAYFALECDAVVLDEEPHDAPVEVVYPGRDIDPTSTHPQPSDEHDAVPARSVTDTEDELRETLEWVEDAHPYDIFDLWEGCGEQAVRDRYYELVKDHHPDSYGGNISTDAKKLAEQVFVEIKDAHTDLLGWEDEQIVPPPEERSDAGPEIDFELDDGGEGADESLETTTNDLSETTPDRSDANFDVAASASGTTKLRSESEQEILGSADADTTPPPGDAAASSPHDRRDGLGSSPSSTASTTETADPEHDPDARKEIFEDLKRRSEGSMAASSSIVSDLEEEDSNVGVSETSSQTEAVDAPSETNTLEAPEDEDDAKEYFNKGYKAYKNDNERMAFELFERAHKFDRSNALFKTFYAYVLFLRNPDRRDDARKLLREAIESDNRQVLPDAHLFLGRILKVKEQHERAKQHFQRSLDLNPASIEAKRELRLYEMRGDLPSPSTSSETSSDEDGDDEPSFKEDPAGYIKNLLNKDIF